MNWDSEVYIGMVSGENHDLDAAAALPTVELKQGIDKVKPVPGFRRRVRDGAGTR